MGCVPAYLGRLATERRSNSHHSAGVPVRSLGNLAAVYICYLSPSSEFHARLSHVAASETARASQFVDLRQAFAIRRDRHKRPPCVDSNPLAQRTGAIVTGAKGLPVRRDRQIARAAGIPDEIWNMDARAGGATEADEAGAALEAIQGALTHTKESTTLRYLRRGRSKKIGQVAEARSAKRATDHSPREQPWLPPREHRQNRASELRQNQHTEGEEKQMLSWCGREDSNLHGLPR
jgi:hypothetical protein